MENMTDVSLSNGHLVPHQNSSQYILPENIENGVADVSVIEEELLMLAAEDSPLIGPLGTVREKHPSNLVEWMRSAFDATEGNLVDSSKHLLNRLQEISLAGGQLRNHRNSQHSSATEVSSPEKVPGKPRCGSIPVALQVDAEELAAVGPSSSSPSAGPSNMTVGTKPRRLLPSVPCPGPSVSTVQPCSDSPATSASPVEDSDVPAPVLRGKRQRRDTVELDETTIPRDVLVRQTSILDLTVNASTSPGATGTSDGVEPAPGHIFVAMEASLLQSMMQSGVTFYPEGGAASDMDQVFTVLPTNVSQLEQLTFVPPTEEESFSTNVVEMEEPIVPLEHQVPRPLRGSFTLTPETESNLPKPEIYPENCLTLEQYQAAKELEARQDSPPVDSNSVPVKPLVSEESQPGKSNKSVSVSKLCLPKSVISSRNRLSTTLRHGASTTVLASRPWETSGRRSSQYESSQQSPSMCSSLLEPAVSTQPISKPLSRLLQPRHKYLGQSTAALHSTSTEVTEHSVSLPPRDKRAFTSNLRPAYSMSRLANPVGSVRRNQPVESLKSAASTQVLASNSQRTNSGVQLRNRTSRGGIINGNRKSTFVPTEEPPVISRPTRPTSTMLPRQLPKPGVAMSTRVSSSVNPPRPSPASQLPMRVSTGLPRPTGGTTGIPSAATRQ